MKILFYKSFRKAAKILGPVLALIDNFYILDAFFFLKSLLRLKVKTSDKNIEIITISDNRDELFRGKRSFTKEPETIEWIDSFFMPGDVFFDVGANIGIFSLYAAKKVKDLLVFAFEPLALNFAKLNENIKINKLGQKIIALPIALHNKDSLSFLNINNFSSGTSGSQYASDRDYLGNRFRPVFTQGCIGFSLDSLINKDKLPVPNHIKIDVDGNESLIIEGSKTVLSNPILRTILIELALGFNVNPEVDRASRETIKLLESYRFRLIKVSKVGSDLSTLNYLFARASANT